MTEQRIDLKLSAEDRATPLLRDMALRLRMEFGLLTSSGGRRVTKRKAEHHARMEAYWLKRAWGCGRMPYVEGPGFTYERPSGVNVRVKGHEVPYGPGSRPFWKYVRLAMKDAFLSGWHNARGTTYQTVEGGRDHAILKGLSS